MTICLPDLPSVCLPSSQIRLLETEGNLGDHTVYLPPLEADKSGEKFTYGRVFPSLRAELFDEPAPSASQDGSSIPDGSRSAVPAGDLATSRTKQETKRSQAIAQHVSQRPKQWAKYLVGLCSLKIDLLSDCLSIFCSSVC